MNKRGAGVVTLVIGAIAAIIGVIVGLVPVIAAGATCGSVFAPLSFLDDTLGSAYTDVSCQSALAGRTGWVWFLIIAGILAVIVGTILAVSRPPEPKPYRPDLSERLAERAQEKPTA